MPDYVYYSDEMDSDVQTILPVNSENELIAPPAFAEEDSEPELLEDELRQEISALSATGIASRAVADVDEMVPRSLMDQSPDALFEQLIAYVRKKHPQNSTVKLEEAYHLAREAHKEQKRKSGEPYITHPLHVALILAKLDMDRDSIVAGILHDVVEDTDTTLSEIESRFGASVSQIVDGVTKLTRITLGTGDKLEMQAENLRKMFLAMSKDIRIIIVKLADRLHNMRTLSYMTPEKQREKATETLEIYAPLASRLGIFRVKMELDNLSLSVLEPEKYKRLVADIDSRAQTREEFIQHIVEDVSSHLKNNGYKAQVYGRVKHYFSIYKKMVTQNKTLDEIYDLFAVRVLVDTIPECYAVLGTIHELYIPMPGRFKDYIAMPKSNMYQSLHTTVIGNSGIPFEVQIRTFEMHRIAEYGVAAHWKYKEGKTSAMPASKDEDQLNWLRQILEWQRDLSDNSEFMDSVKNDLDIFSDTVYCFTPKGDVKNLPKGSTPVDLAYSIHSAVGNNMVGARVNDKLVNIDYVIQNGDRVEIITSQNSRGPSLDWLKFVKSTQARNKINAFYKEQNKEENLERGRDLFERYCKTKGIVQADILKPEFMDKILMKYGFRDWNAVLASIGHGGLKEGQVINKMLEDKKRQDQKQMTDEQVLELVSESGRKNTAGHKGGIVVEGLEDLAVHFSKCCSPIPGDEIVGFITRGRGVSVHRTDCPNIINLPEAERSRLIEAEWHLPSEGGSEKYTVELSVYATNRMGLLADISRLLAEMNIDLTGVNSKVTKQQQAILSLQFSTSGKAEITNVINKLRQIHGIEDVVRSVSS